MGNMHVANGSKKNLRVIVAHECVTIPAIEETGKVGTEPFRMSEASKGPLDEMLNSLGFAILGPGDALPFHLSVAESDLFVTILTADEASPIILCYNGIPPPGMSVIVTKKGGIQLSKHCGKYWKTSDGLVYEHVNQPKPDVEVTQVVKKDPHDKPTHRIIGLGTLTKRCALTACKRGVSKGSLK